MPTEGIVVVSVREPLRRGREYQRIVVGRLGSKPTTLLTRGADGRTSRARLAISFPTRTDPRKSAVAPQALAVVGFWWRQLPPAPNHVAGNGRH